ncbi:Beta-galactosidase [Anaerohalosphaera lusitana]|uniref:alpha-L-fucosidase n=1 Tax=Anaerohalosphaera lusitana TaxID=1936003 RepID=A0A1U9NP08_9BACT|nr:alpha-L-fucosidase [Anaerohalosphaera lusitana]AQT69340.1 Beta-galactosidase [Anaerohalosphaera lusitana]
MRTFKKFLVTACLALTFGLTHARQVKPLTGQWQFIKSDVSVKDSTKDTIDGKSWQTVTVPHTWNAKDAQSGGEYYTGTACYRKTVDIPADLKGKRIFIRFEGVGQVADVYINGKKAGSHKGAYSAFCYEITPGVEFGQTNTIFVRANNEPRPDVIPVNHNLFMVFGGIYRPVSLIITDDIHITPTDYASPGIYIRQNSVTEEKADITVTAKLKNDNMASRQVQMRTIVKDAQDKVVATKSSDLTLPSMVVNSYKQSLTVENPTLWHGRKNPYLYSLTVQLTSEGNVLDEVTEPLGLRYYSMDKQKGFILNGEPYRLYGVCRHQEWKDHGSALTNEQHKTDFDMIYDIGATSIRLAHYQQAEFVYDYCDKLGFIIWAEVPFVNTWKGQEGENAKQQIRELVRQNYNHPSIFVWGLHNEVYGSSTMSYPVQVTKEMHDIAKTEDPDRFTVSVSGYGSLKRPMDCHADLQGNNRYFGWYYGAPDGLGPWIEGTRKVRPDTLVSVSEYGAGGNPDHQAENLTKANPISGQFFSEQYQAMIHEVQWAQIEEHPIVWSSYVWNMFDFCVPGWNRGGVKGLNHKGLVTYDRKTKKAAFYMYKANWSDDPVLYIRDKRLKERTNPAADIVVYSNLKDVTLTLNGKDFDSVNPDHCVFTWQDVVLESGKNTVKVTATRDGKTFTDTCTWNVDPSKADLGKGVIASSSETSKGNIARNAADGKTNTYWSTNERNPWIRFELKEPKEVDEISILWYNSSERVYPFEIETSLDGQTWKQALSTKSRSEKGFETYKFDPVKAKYVRIKGHGNNKTAFTAMYEVKLDGLAPVGDAELDKSAGDTQKVEKDKYETWVRRTDSAAEKWRDNRFGQFIHWGIYSLLGGEYDGKTYDYAAEWIQVSARIPGDEYAKLANEFNPEKFDAKRWAKLFKQAGVKYVVITTKHHDGFCLWDSKYTEFDMASTPYGKGVLKELADAVRAEGIDMGFYYSIIDWNHPDYKYAIKSDADRKQYRRYLDYMKDQLTELMTEFGEIKILWFDGRWDPAYKQNPEYGIEIEAHCRELNPDVIINDRVRAYDSLADYDAQYERRLPNTEKLASVDWESCMTIPKKTWGYHKAPGDWKSSKTIVEMLAKCASHSGNFLLNIGPKPDGSIREEEATRLKTVGEWMDRNGQAIYGCSKPDDHLTFSKGIQLSAKDDKLFAMIFDADVDKVTIEGMYKKPESVVLLSSPDANWPAWDYSNGKLTIELPEKQLDPIAPVFQITLDD